MGHLHLSTLVCWFVCAFKLYLLIEHIPTTDELIKLKVKSNLAGVSVHLIEAGFFINAIRIKQFCIDSSILV